MKETLKEPYPGSTASIWELLDLANQYYHAAIALFERAEKEAPLSYAPARLCCIHAIELYLSVFLRNEGLKPEQIRGRMHSLDDALFVEKLKLSKRTAQHLKDMTANREYLVARYAPNLISDQSETNRLLATLVQIMMKVGNYVRLGNSMGASSD